MGVWLFSLQVRYTAATFTLDYFKKIRYSTIRRKPFLSANKTGTRNRLIREISYAVPV